MINSPLKSILFILALVFSVMACTKTIEVPLQNAGAQLVIEGKILNTPGPYYVLLSNSTKVSAGSKYPAVSGAVVKITDKTSGKTEQLKEIVAGKYATKSIIGAPGHTYQLTAVIKGNTYTASSMMPKAIKLDSVTFQKISVIGDERIFAVGNFRDPAGTENYYIFKEYVNGRDRSGITFAFDDRLSDGKKIAQSLFTDSSFIRKGDKVSIEMSCVDKKVYTYFNSLMIAGNSQSGTPANPISNITGKNNALGYFSAQTISKSENIVK